MRLVRLDGIRGIAILAVIAFHHRFLLEVGWAGVDLFFVLSGFLITRILRASAARNSYWSRFYLKRAARILPPLLLLFAFALVLSRHISPITLAGYALFFGNVMNLTRYQNGLFGALWSLAVEEHFYILFPFAVRYLSRRGLLLFLSALLIFSPLARAVATSHTSGWETIYFLTPFRLDGLAVGALLALLTESVTASRWLRRWSLAGSLASVSIFAALRLLDPLFVRDLNTPVFNAFGYTLTAAAGFFFIGYVVLKESSRVSRLLAWKPLVYLGRISYGLYLFHPVVVIALRKVFGIPFGAGASSADLARLRLLLPLDLAVTIPLAALSFHFYEKRVLAWGEQRARRLEVSVGDSLISEQAAVTEAPVH